VVNTNLGKLSGIKDYQNGKTVHVYLGVPYAEPPIGELRFRKPKKLNSWLDVYSADTQPPKCIQMKDSRYNFDINNNNVYGWNNYNHFEKIPESEDCLYLNIYVPQGGAEKKTVLAFFMVVHFNVVQYQHRFTMEVT